MTYMHDGEQYIVVAISSSNYAGELLAFRLPGLNRAMKPSALVASAVHDDIRCGRCRHVLRVRNAGGYTAAEMRCARRTKAEASSKWDIDTPALCVDLDKFARTSRR